MYKAIRCLCHGRIDSRKTEVFEITEFSRTLDSEWNNISCIVKTYRTRKAMNIEKKCYNELKTNISYNISTNIYDAKTFAKIIQCHPGIENKVNYVKDV